MMLLITLSVGLGPVLMMDGDGVSRHKKQRLVGSTSFIRTIRRKYDSVGVDAKVTQGNTTDVYMTSSAVGGFGDVLVDDNAGTWC